MSYSDINLWNTLIVNENDDLRNLPLASGLYAVMKDDTVVYIGRSVKLRTRWWIRNLRIKPKEDEFMCFEERLSQGGLGVWQYHKMLEYLLEKDGYYLKWIECPREDIVIEEYLLIRKYRPEKNVHWKN